MILAAISMLAVMELAPLAIGQNADEPGRNGIPRRQQRFANLSPAERQQLKAAHDKAMQDPAVQSAHAKMRVAHKEFRDAMRSSMLKADPSIQPILSKIPESRLHDS